MQRGVIGRRVAANVRTLRQERELDLADLSAELSELGHPISLSGLSKLETGSRRVDVDDLVALAQALGVHPQQLLRADLESFGVTGGDLRAHGDLVKPLLDVVAAAHRRGVSVAFLLEVLEVLDFAVTTALQTQEDTQVNIALRDDEGASDGER